MKPALLVLEDGTFFPGIAFGHNGEAIGELACDTGMSNYHELLTDPTSGGRLLVLTSNHVGNHGVCDIDQESLAVHAPGLIVRNLSRMASNYRSDHTLGDYAQANDVVGITEVDTRALMIHLREHGAQMGAIVHGASEEDVDDIVQKLRSSTRYEAQNFVQNVSVKEPKRVFFTAHDDAYHRRVVDLNDVSTPWPEDLNNHKDIVVLDLGVRFLLLEGLDAAGMRTTLVPHSSSVEEILATNPQGVVLSNGPGNPDMLADVQQVVRELVGKVPLFGVGLGAQLLAVALGGETHKLHNGEYAQNIPVRNAYDQRTDITTHRHAFGIRFPAKDEGLEITHINLNDQSVQGFHNASLKARGVQHHPEAGAGRYGTSPLFDAFKKDFA